jgi:hypothetical protein
MFKTRGAVSTIDAMCEAYGKKPLHKEGLFCEEFLVGCWFACEVWIYSDSRSH